MSFNLTWALDTSKHPASRPGARQAAANIPGMEKARPEYSAPGNHPGYAIGGVLSLIGAPGILGLIYVQLTNPQLHIFANPWVAVLLAILAVMAAIGFYWMLGPLWNLPLPGTPRGMVTRPRAWNLLPWAVILASWAAIVFVWLSARSIAISVPTFAEVFRGAAIPALVAGVLQAIAAYALVRRTTHEETRVAQLEKYIARDEYVKVQTNLPRRAKLTLSDNRQRINHRVQLFDVAPGTERDFEFPLWIFNDGEATADSATVHLWLPWPEVKIFGWKGIYNPTEYFKEQGLAFISRLKVEGRSLLLCYRRHHGANLSQD